MGSQILKARDQSLLAYQQASSSMAEFVGLAHIEKSRFIPLKSKFVHIHNKEELKQFIIS